MEFKTMSTDQLHEWEVNKELRAITEENYERLKLSLLKKNQFKPLIVTPDGFGNYIVLAGNHRLRAYRELGVPSLWVTVIEFMQNEAGLWYGVRDGVEEPERYNSKEDAMMDWGVTDNEEVAHYDRESFVNIMDNYNLNWDERLLNFSTPLTVRGSLHAFGIDPDADNAEDNTDTATTQYTVVVECTNEIEQQEQFEKLAALGMKAKMVTR